MVSKEEQCRRLAVVVSGYVTMSDDPGEKLRLWRNAFGVSQTDLGDRMGVSHTTVSDYERGRRDNPEVEFISGYVNSLIELADRETIREFYTRNRLDMRK